MFGFVKILFAIIYVLGSEKNRQNRESEVHKNAGAELMNSEHFGKSFSDMPIAMWTMLKNPTFTFTSLGGVSESFLICGYTAFLPKIIQNQFHQTAGKAAAYAGIQRVVYNILKSIFKQFL